MHKDIQKGGEISMADKVISVENMKAFWHSQVHDPEKWDLNMKLLRALGLFAGSIVLMRQYGDMMAI
ncbi:mitochondrial import receptor subunit TOM5 homolog isoform X1 [Andrographis paniculata]|uniref:mitochondrial import receptor subunit TOM5 homolog isoform X1 n=2 Tax=Andrographis paniculata TaxID=175694 RepID=UPI0021E91E3F|nr:mitochondrial import receptor subunit TOM5 homolog isoform X1 [Andrographis paniculata]